MAMYTHKPNHEVIIVGSGISGISSALALLRQGFKDFLILEAADGPGGVWRENRYPGVACDIPAMLYQFRDEKNPRWSKLYAGGSEILQYLKALQGKHRLDEKTRYGASVEKAEYDEANSQWAITTKNGEIIRCRYLIKATGAFGSPKIPSLPGLSEFRGALFHTANWPHDIDLSGKRVAVVGTGASAIQLVPVLAKSAASLTVFQRTPIWLLPKLDLRIAPPVRWVFEHMPGVHETCHKLAYKIGGNLLAVLLVTSSKYPRAHKLLEASGRWNIRRQIKDPVLRERFKPDYSLGCKRPSFSNDYFRVFELPHVHLNTGGIERLTATGILAKGSKHVEPFDAIIMATGFDVLGEKSNNLPAFTIRGKGGIDLREYWHHQEGFKAYRGAGVAGFPNLFLNLGIPYAGGTSWYETADIVSAQIVECLRIAKSRSAQEIEVRPEAVDAYMQKMHGLLRWSVHRTGSCASSNSYYYDANGNTPLYTAEPAPESWREAVNSVSGSYEFRTARRTQATAVVA